MWTALGRILSHSPAFSWCLLSLQSLLIRASPGGHHLWIFWAEGESDLLLLPHLSLLLDFSVGGADLLSSILPYKVPTFPLPLETR